MAFGIGADGRKIVLGLREGATENASVVSTLLGIWRGAGWTSASELRSTRTGKGARPTRAGLENR